MSKLEDINKKMLLFYAQNIKGQAKFGDLCDIAWGLKEISQNKGEDPKEIQAIVDKLVRHSEGLFGNEDEERGFAVNVLEVYANIGENNGFSPTEASRMLVNRQKLSPMLESGDKFRAYASGVVGLEYKDIAEGYVNRVDKMCDSVGEIDYKGGLVIKNCGKIVSRHTDLAEKCNSVVNKIIDKIDTDSWGFEDRLEEAVEYCDKVIAKCDGKAKEEAKKMKAKCSNKNDDAGYQYEMSRHSHTTGGQEM